MEIRTKGLRIRWLYETCFEIVLPGGEVVLTDPDLNLHAELPVKASDLTRVDYIVISHTHYDHTSDIGYLVDKFHPKLLVGELSAQSICRCFDIQYESIYPVGDGETFDFGDVCFHFFRGKHTSHPDPTKGRAASSLNTTEGRFGFKGHGECDQYGWMEFYNFVMTASNNQRVMFCGGLLPTTTHLDAARKFRPDILLRQPSGANTPEDYACQIAPIRAQVAFPAHHEHLAQAKKVTLEEFFGKTQSALDEMGCATTFINPVQGKWYEIGAAVYAED